MEDKKEDANNNNGKSFEIRGDNIINDNEEKNSNIIQENTIAVKDNYNSNIDEIWNKNSKYKIKYSHIIKYLQSKDKNEFYNENEYWCNILLMPSKIEFSNKISILSLLSKYYQKKGKKDLVYNIGCKLDKYIESFGAIDPVFLINIYIKVMEILNSQNLPLYSINYIFKIKDIINKNKVVIDKYDLSGVYKFFEEIKDDYINYITNCKIKYFNEDNYKIEQINEMKNLIDLLITDLYNLDNNTDTVKDDKNNYLYIVNKNWIYNAKFFIENYIKAREQKIQIFYEESFDPNYVYESYFNINNEKNEKKNTKNTKNKKGSNGFYAFPGPVNNLEITSFKDSWTDSINLEENDFLKKGMNYKKDYLYVNDKDWGLIKNLFGTTNEIKRKKNLDLVELKIILFDRRINQENYNINLLKQKYIQINKNSNIKQLKEKIINISYENFKNLQEENENDSKNKKISFFIIDKNKKKLLIEMIFSFLIIPKYDSLFIKKIEFKDENKLKDLFNEYNKEKHILIVELYNMDEPNFFVDLKLEMIQGYKCTKCNKKIENLIDKYNCEICNFSLFCSQECSKKSKEHKKLDNQCKVIYEKKFILSDLLTLDLYSILPENGNHGIVGLFNMGNTCYLNSALQCLSNTEDLTKYFLKQYFKSEINNGSSLGSKGYISGEYYKLIDLMWNQSIRQFCPKEFRIKFCRKTQLFLNSEQQDSQEFLLAVLDNLHEDLNRITNKKYMELKEKQKGESDEEASKRWWDYYKSRDNSIIMDLFQGQYKSTIKCAQCGNTSISYETYLNLGLPIPVKNIQSQIKFLTADQNYIELNYNINENIKLKDIINKAIVYLNKKKYFEYLNNTKENKKNLNEKNIEIPKNILYNNIEVIEFGKGLKMTNIYKTSYENINKKDIKKDNTELYDNIKLDSFYKNNNNSELVLFEKEVNNDHKNYSYIYIFPIVEKIISGFFGSSTKKIILSYPLILSIKNENTLEDLIQLIYEKLKNIIKIKQENKDEIPIEICFPHFTNNWGIFYIKKEECPICYKKYEKENKHYCNLLDSFKKNNKISVILNKLNKDSPLILYAKIQDYKDYKEIYSGIRLFNEKINRNDTKNILNIYDSLDLFNKEEILDSDNMWYCNICKKHQNALKKIQIYKTPIYLIIQLKRFIKRNTILRTLFGNKNETNVDYKEVLNLKDFIVGPDKNNSIYHLYGVIIHKKLMNGGHYYAYCKNNGRWIKYDDENFSECKNPTDKDAYLLFYKRKNIE